VKPGLRTVTPSQEYVVTPEPFTVVLLESVEYEMDRPNEIWAQQQELHLYVQDQQMASAAHIFGGSSCDQVLQILEGKFGSQKSTNT